MFYVAFLIKSINLHTTIKGKWGVHPITILSIFCSFFKTHPLLSCFRVYCVVPSTEQQAELDHMASRALFHPLLKTTLTGLRRTYLRFLVFRPKLTKTKRFPPFLDHMNGKLFLGGSRFWSGKIGPKLALGGHRSQCPAELSFIFNRCPAGNPLFLTDKIYF